MRKERRVIIDKIMELDRMIEADIELGCGFGAETIYQLNEPRMQELRDQLARTYGDKNEPGLEHWI